MEVFWQHHMLNRDIDCFSLASFQDINPFTSLSRLSPLPSAILKDHPSSSLHFLSLDVLLPLQVLLICPLSLDISCPEIFYNFYSVIRRQSLCSYQLSLPPSPSPWFRSSPFLNLSHHLIRSRITHACGMVVPMPALCQSAWACLCASVSLVGSPLHRRSGWLISPDSSWCRVRWHFVRIIVCPLDRVKTN